MASIQTPSQPRMSAEALFDDVGPAYEVAFADVPSRQASITWIKEQLAARKPAKILDIGCGTGKPVCSSLADAGHEVLGIDVSSVMVEHARKNVANAEFRKTSVGDFDAPPASYDAITVYFSLIASITQDSIRQEIKRIFTWLKPDGIFVFATVPFSSENAEIEWMGRPITVSGLETDDMLKWMVKVGFEVVRHDVTSFMPKSVDAGLCKAEEAWEEEHLFVYAKKPLY